MNPFLATVVLLAGLTQTSNSVGASVSSVNYDVAAANGPVAVSYSTPEQSVFGSMTVAPGGLGGEAGALEQAQRAVLVIPTPDLPPESMADLTEDLTVMCRIFDKSLASPRSPIRAADAHEAELLQQYLNSISFRNPGTQGLYLDGYGALFFLRVEYPLVPTGPQESTPAKPTESADSVWSQTVKEMSGQADNQPQGGTSIPTYDALKVGNLKNMLIRTLAHASNVRMRRPQDMITLVVGNLEEGRESTAYRVEAVSRSRARIAPMPPGAGRPQAAVRSPAAALLILRATKADVDTFAKGQLTLAQFTEKVQTVWSPPESATPTTAPAPTTVSTR